MTRHRPTALLLLVLFAGAAHAHPGHGDASFWISLLHPLAGLDHVLAMLAVGLWSVLRDPRGARALPMLPILFVGGAALGTALGQAGVLDGGIETAVAASLLPLGLALAAGLRGAHLPALLLVAVCGLLHGAAHGHAWTGQPIAASGFLLGTALLHALGAASMRALPAARRRRVAAGVGSGIAAAGVWLLA